MSPGSLYSEAGNRRQPTVLCAVALAALALSLGACSAIGMPSATDNIVTGSIAPLAPVRLAKPASMRVIDSVDASDWEAIRSAVTNVPATETADGLDWTNAATGTAGTISALTAASSTHGSLCRSFSTTVNDIRGIRRYRGDACERTDGRWQLFGMAADDASLS